MKATYCNKVLNETVVLKNVKSLNHAVEIFEKVCNENHWVPIYSDIEISVSNGKTSQTYTPKFNAIYWHRYLNQVQVIEGVKDLDQAISLFEKACTLAGWTFNRYAISIRIEKV